MATCGHAFHRLCAEEYVQSAPVPSDPKQEQKPAAAPTLGCPACFAPLTIDLSSPLWGEGSNEGKPAAAAGSSAKASKAKKGRKQTESASEDEGDEMELAKAVKVTSDVF